MKKFKVVASYVTYCYAEIHADTQEEAEEIAQEMDGGEFSPERWGGDDWTIESVQEVPMTEDDVRIVPVRIAGGSVWAECSESVAQAWSVEILLGDGTWDSREIIKFYDEEHKWETLQDARRIAQDILAGESV